MTKAQIKVFEELLATEGFKGKEQLRHVLWLNTVPPKFQKGDCFIVSDPGHRVYGHPVRNFKGKIVDVKAWKDQEDWYYKIEMDVRTGDKRELVHCWFYESKLSTVGRCNDNVNVLGDPKNDTAEALDVALPI